jgi:thioredoxin-dependent peroxiredoxin
VRDDADRYAAQGIVVFGINGQSMTSHRGFAQRHGLTTRLLTDTGLRVARQYDAVLRLGPFAFVKRTVVGIDRSQRIIFYRRGMPTTGEILSAFSAEAESPHTGKKA